MESVEREQGECVLETGAGTFRVRYELERTGPSSFKGTLWLLEYGSIGTLRDGRLRSTSYGDLHVLLRSKNTFGGSARFVAEQVPSRV